MVKAYRYLIDFMGIKEQAEKFELGAFDLKLFRLEKIEGKAENFAIVTTLHTAAAPAVRAAVKT